ncbi:hypothetical protein RN001_004141 [Aquatica leii]|uniref:Monocarboxylate transporter n=1 Tax=Aquatica leii TaxID=1421715 RepID=A0AAN7QC76_9COLE|nr:hypothetical protein RN001_004141 [Aquatica leii]
MSEKNISKEDVPKIQGYEFVPPDGGWGYMVALSMIVTFNITYMPIVAFGIIYGQFLENLTDEASATGLINGSTLAIQWCSGIIANPLLQRISYRKVSVLGATIFITGIFATIFITTVNQLLVFSILQGLGTGLIMCSTYTAFNYYFAKKSNFVLSVTYTIMVIIAVVFPSFFFYCMNTYGFRGTLIILAGLSLNCLPAVLCLHPVKWYRKKKLLDVTKDQSVPVNAKSETQERSCNSDDSKGCCTMCLRLWIRLARYLDLSLFLDPIYVNTTVGVSLCVASDYAFISILPLLLKNISNTNNDNTFLTIFYGADIVGRILLTILNAFTTISPRKLTLIGSILAVLFRTTFVKGNSFWWLAVCLSLMGSIRCVFQTNYSLIYVEMYKERFVTAYSLFSLVCGIVSLVSGVLIGVVKSSTQSNVMVVHLLSTMCGICATTWLVEMFITKFLKKSV